MTDSPLTLKNFLVSDAAKPLGDSVDMGALLPALGTALAALPGQFAEQAKANFKQALDGITQIGIGDVLMASWGKVGALMDAVHATRKDETLLAVVPLLDHKITSKHSPHIDLVYAGKSLVSVPFDITLNLALKGVMLEVQSGSIKGVKHGSCAGDGNLAFGGRTLLQHKTKELMLPGKLAFSKQEAKAPPA